MPYMSTSGPQWLPLGSPWAPMGLHWSSILDDEFSSGVATGVPRATGDPPGMIILEVFPRINEDCVNILRKGEIYED